MSRPVDQTKNAEKFLADTVHEERVDKVLWAMRIRPVSTYGLRTLIRFGAQPSDRPE
jgi:hypothetical protein